MGISGVRYFAYGSNMSLPRLRQRVPGAKRLGAYALAEHSLRFHKVSKIDGSAKCDALFTGHSEDCVIGALFEIPENEKLALDRAEGLGFGYEEKRVLVSDSQGSVVEAFTYYATHTDPDLLPYSWYLYHVIYGAMETDVPAGYLGAIEATISKEDPDRDRDASERAIYR
ncbi:gamma-glutamylcyclotransferase family protein [uncultured Marinobacter sp.]|uniref:gamma-glutamylcyclotransferase family protein n=1 Tax=uncultured Marinobacter sp. TaxID=187379 RepID=UPI002604A596|nr:gamma-glutamylcyclotransferase family protein [uncultured Marinobacter sp.]